MSDFSLRSAEPADAAGIAGLSIQLGYATEGPAVAARLEALRGRDEVEVVVAVSDSGRVLGWAQAALVEYVFHEVFAELMGLVVDEPERGRGVGASLIRAVENWAAGRGAVTLSLRSNVIREEAHRFYEGLGFERVKTQYTFRKKLGSVSGLPAQDP